MVQWDVDDRSATRFTRVYIRTMWWAHDKRAFEGRRHTLETALKRQESGDHPPTPWTRLARRTTTGRLADMTTWTVAPRRRAPAARVLYLHGGGYIHPLTADYWRLVRALTRTPAEVVVPAYPLAPSATVDDVLPGLVDAAGHLLGREPALPLFLMGDSAGGALSLVVAQALRDRGGLQPAGVVALCPWLDATLDEDSVGALEPSDPMLAESGLRAAGRWWARPRHPSDPLVSPVEGSLVGLPPLHVLIGDRDILRPAVDALADLAREEDARLHVHEVPAMFHVWMTRFLPEAHHTRRELVRLVRNLLPGPDQP